MDLKYAKVLVTGGSSGIGLETARQLRKKGARVTVSARDEERLNRAAKEVGAFAVAGDVGNESDVVAMVNRAMDLMSGLNVVVNNAGYGIFRELGDLTEEEMTGMFRTNVLGATLVAREAAKHFIQQDYGNIINIGSSAGLRGFAGGSAYVATKFALRGLTECWRAELRKHNVRVMLINPSEVQTEFFAAAGKERAVNERKLFPSDIAHAVVSLLEMEDRGFVTELAVWATNPEGGRE